MAKRFATLLLFLFSLFCFSQMDSEHWFAPMASNTPANGKGSQLIYLSTNSIIPVNIKIYGGNKLLGTITIKKGDPQFFYDWDKSQIIVENNDEKMKVLNKGVHLVGDGNFYANLRFSIPEEAEMVTSKGRSALGKTFFLGMQKGKVRYSNNIASILATEDNTTVTLSNYEPSLVFTNDKTPNTAQKTILLNKGESYIYEVDNINANNASFDGLIGAKVQSDKPISVTCGNFLAGLNQGRDYYNDIFMDQTIPVEKIGTEYILMSGYGSIADASVMEKTLIVASEDNTEVFLNDNKTGTPDFILPKAGSFQFVKSLNYKPSDPVNNVYSLYVKTSKPAYVYQILAGSPISDISSGAMSIIPPLSCLLPSKIDEIASINENLTMDSNGNYVDNDVKLNIITQKGANVFLNDSKANINGPFPISGNNDWEAYTSYHVTGTITVSTDNKKAVTFGIAAGNGSIGYGGYFAGFNVEPYITGVGDCDDFKYLEVQDNYDEYEWYYSPDQINWTKLAETSNRLDPLGVYGYYKCKVIKQACSTFLFSDVFLYKSCTVVGPPQSYTLSFCESLSPPITPKFSKKIGAPIDIIKTKITKDPEEGKAYIDNLGNIHFEAENSTLEKVTFTYYFEGYGSFPDSEEVTVTINLTQIKVENKEIFSCVDSSGLATYNLKDFETTSTDPTITKFEYFTDKNLSNEIPSSELNNYKSSPNTIIYVKVSNAAGCYRIGELSLKTYTPPVISIQINGRSATINATGGLPPYQYAIENSKEFIDFQDNNVFNNLPIGLNTVYVLSSDKCTKASQDFMITQLLNVITPNADGYNDILDYSEMKYKNNFSIQIFNRYGLEVYKSNGQKYTWDGKLNGKSLPTDTYWYIIQWEEPKTQQTFQFTNYLLLKNSN